MFGYQNETKHIVSKLFADNVKIYHVDNSTTLSISYTYIGKNFAEPLTAKSFGYFLAERPHHFK